MHIDSFLMAPVEKTLPSEPLSIGSAVPKTSLDGLCQLHAVSGTWLLLCLSCQIKDSLSLSFRRTAAQWKAYDMWADRAENRREQLTLRSVGAYASSF